MKQSFKEFLRDNIGDPKKEPQYKSIPHLEDLDIDDILDVLLHLRSMICTEKLDGAALKFGLDNSGKFYTTRAGKGDPTLKYSADEYPTSGGGNVFKAAHSALEKKLNVIKTVLGSGEAMDIEVLFGRRPNTVMYGMTDTNYIAILRAVDGTDPNKDPSQDKVQKLANALQGNPVQVRTIMLQTPDGLQLIEQPMVTTWDFMAPTRFDTSEIKNVDIGELINKLRSYLASDNADAAAAGVGSTNLDVYKVSLNNVPSEHKDKIKASRESVKEIVLNDYILPIKNKILDEFSRKYKSKAQTTMVQPKDEIGIEGLVFLDPDTQMQFKVVDKDTFKALNDFNYAVRYTIRGKILTDDIYAPIKSRGGLYGNTLIRIVGLFNIPGLARSNNVKKVLRTFKGSTETETVKNISATLINSNFNAIKRKMLAIIDNTAEDLEDTLIQFKKEYKGYKKELPNGKTIVGYNQDVYERTLLVFAETNRDLKNLRSQIAKAKDIGDLVMNLFGRHILAIHKEQ